jgi:hypothetical protein
MARVVALHHAAKRVEEGLERTAAFEHSEGPLVERIAQRTPLVTQRRLGRSHHHGGRWGIHATKNLQDARAGGLPGTVADRQADVDHRDVDTDLAHHLVAFGKISGTEASNALRLEQPRQEISEGVIAPAAIGKEQIKVRSAVIMR